MSDQHDAAAKPIDIIDRLRHQSVNPTYDVYINEVVGRAADEITALRAATAQHAAEVERVTKERDAMREAIEQIHRWKVPKVFDPNTGKNVSLGVLCGSNGERDYFRGVALAALTPPPTPNGGNDGK